MLLGAWIAPEARAGAARAANRAQVDDAVRLANAYPDLVIGLVVGNETQVSWSGHKVRPEVLIGWLREARRGTAVPGLHRRRLRLLGRCLRVTRWLGRWTSW